MSQFPASASALRRRASSIAAVGLAVAAVPLAVAGCGGASVGPQAMNDTLEIKSNVRQAGTFINLSPSVMFRRGVAIRVNPESAST
jgi:hypothetical protein